MFSKWFRFRLTRESLLLLVACLATAAPTLSAAPPVSPGEPYKRQVLFGLYKQDDIDRAFRWLGGLEGRLTEIGLTEMVWKFHSAKGMSEKYHAFVLIAFKVDPRANTLNPVKELMTPDSYKRFGAEVVHLTQKPVHDERKQFAVKVNEETLVDGNKKGRFLTADGFLLDGIWCHRRVITDTTEENDGLRKAAQEAGGTLKADYSATSSEFIWFTNLENLDGKVDYRWKVVTFTKGNLTVGPDRDRFEVTHSKLHEIEHE